MAISVLALTAAAEPLLAAEGETAAPREQAAPARERAAPSARRTQPARQQPQRQATQSQASQSSSYTGTQAGGFGGGNAGGGGFADPVNLCQSGLNSGGQFGSPPCSGVPYVYSASHRIQGTGGGFVSYSIPLFGWAVIGVQGEVAAGRISQSNTFTNTHIDTTFPLSRTTTETYTSSFNMGTNGSVLVKFGVPVNVSRLVGSPYPQTVLLYGVVGTTTARIDGTYSYSGINCPNFGPCVDATSAYGALNWSQTRTGGAYGVGVEWAFMPGVNLRVEYRYTSFGSISQNAPIAVNMLAGTPGCVGAQLRRGCQHQHQQSELSNRQGRGCCRPLTRSHYKRLEGLLAMPAASFICACGMCYRPSTKAGDVNTIRIAVRPKVPFGRCTRISAVSLPPIARMKPCHPNGRAYELPCCSCCLGNDLHAGAQPGRSRSFCEALRRAFPGGQL